MDTVFSKKSTCSHGLSIYNVFDRFFYLRHIVIFKVKLAVVHLSITVIIPGSLLLWPRIFKGTVLFWKSTCSHAFFQGIELIRNSSCSYLFDEWPFFITKEQLQPRIFSNLLCFWRTGIAAKKIINTNYDTSLFSGMHILKEMWKRSSSYPSFLWWWQYLTGALEAIHMSMILCLFHNTCYSNKRSVLDSRKFEGYVYLMKVIAALIF